MEEHCRAKQAAAEKDAMCMPVNEGKNTNTHSLCWDYVLLFHGNSGYANASKYYVIGTLPVFVLICVLTGAS
jgi:hypothetical protein